MSGPDIRVARPDDAAALLAIYAPYVTGTAITFEYQVPSVEEFRGRIEHTLARYPYLVAEQDGGLLGYAYAGTFIGRAACDWAAEASIYLRQDLRRAGLGRRLYQALEDTLRLQNIVNLNACIACPEAEDEYLTMNSIDFHRHIGYRMVGGFHRCGYKFGRWYGLVWMEKMLGGHPAEQQPLIPFPEISDETLRSVGVLR